MEAAVAGLQAGDDRLLGIELLIGLLQGLQEELAHYPGMAGGGWRVTGFISGRHDLPPGCGVKGGRGPRAGPESAWGFP